MAFRSITLNLSVVHVEHSAKLIQLNHAFCLLFENNSVLLFLYYYLLAVLACFFTPSCMGIFKEKQYYLNLSVLDNKQFRT